MEITLEKLMALANQKAPIIGIPLPGDKSFAVSREILAGLLTGLTACQITLTDELEIRAERRHYRLRALDMRRGSEHYKSLRAWAARQRANKATSRRPREERRKAELLRKITVAERKAKRMAIQYRPYNPRSNAAIRLAITNASNGRLGMRKGPCAGKLAELPWTTA
ncbi:MAG TPA: hypothetical protein VFZ08_14225 [Terriglobia bacterium]|nr:hypothetical protein [Terriglobia bacterium]